MKKQLFKGLIILAFIILVILFFLIKNNNQFRDTITYKGKTYVLLEYNMEIFTYHFNRNDYYEEDIIHPVSSDKWDIIYFNGDLYILDSQIKKATEYYSNDKNYKWFVVFDDEYEKKIPISINKEELDYLYQLESIEKKQTMTFDDIKQFSNIVKESEDGLVKALIDLVHYEDSWYWKSEIMTDDDKEYIIKLPDSLSNKIFSLLDK